MPEANYREAPTTYIVIPPPWSLDDGAEGAEGFRSHPRLIWRCPYPAVRDRHPGTMSARGPHFAPSEIPAARSFSAAEPPSPTPAVIWGQDEETRLLLRGLVRLQRHPVVHEATTVEELEQLPTAAGPRILLYAVPSGNGAWATELASVLERHPELRAVVILPPGTPTRETEARRVGARAVLPRPFAIQEFAQALERAID